MRQRWLIPTYLIVLLMGAGFLAANRGLLPPERGFLLFFAGSALALLSTAVLGGTAAVGAALGRAWRRPALLGAIVPLLVTVWIVGGRMQNPVPAIHDITTDFQDPPSFSTIDPVAQNYDADVVGSQQREAYPQVVPIRTPDGVSDAYDRALATARAMPGWEVTREDRSRGQIEAVATTPLFHFRDDVVIRLRPEGDQTRLDLRSRSRFGQSDLGTNAARILAYQKSFESGVAAR